MHLIEKIHKQMNPPTQGHYVINNTFNNIFSKIMRKLCNIPYFPEGRITSFTIDYSYNSI